MRSPAKQSSWAQSLFLLDVTTLFAFTFFDRLIISGAFQQIEDFIVADTHTSSADSAFGLLSTVFIIGYVVSSLACGIAASRFGVPAVWIMIACGGLWTGSIVLTAVAPRYWFMMAARFIAGCSHAGFYVTVPPMINKEVAPDGRAWWIGVFLTGLPLGFSGEWWSSCWRRRRRRRHVFLIARAPASPRFAPLHWSPLPPLCRWSSRALRLPAGGQLYGSYVSTAYSWRAAYWWLLLPVGMALAALVVLGRWHYGPRFWGCGRKATAASVGSKGGGKAAGTSAAATAPLVEADAAPGASGAGTGTGPGGAPGSLWSDICDLLSRPLYLLIVFGYAGYMAVYAGAGSLTGIVLVGLGLVQSEDSAALLNCLSFGISGPLGSLLGGWILQRLLRRHNVTGTSIQEGEEEGDGAWQQAAVAAAEEGMEEAAVGLAGEAPTSGGAFGTVTTDDAGGSIIGYELPYASVNSGGGGGGGSGASAAGDSASEALLVDAGGVVVGASKRGYRLSGTGKVAHAPRSTRWWCVSWRFTQGLRSSDIPLLTDAVAVLAVFLTFSAAVFFTGNGTTLLPHGVYSFFICYVIGTLALMAAVSSMQMSFMLSVPPRLRAFSVGFAVVLGHALGDVPSPYVIGKLLDVLAPRDCPPGTVDVNTCSRSAAGVQRALLLTYSWLGWPVLLWCAAWFLARRHRGAAAPAAAPAR